MTAQEMDVLFIRAMQHARTLRTRIRVMDADDGDIVPCAVLIRPSDDGVEVVRLGMDGEADREIRMFTTRDAALDTVKAFMRTIDRLSRREKAVEANRYDLAAPPSWSLGADVTAMSILRSLGMDPMSALNPQAGARNDPRVHVIRRGERCTVRIEVSSAPGPCWTYDDTSGTPFVEVPSDRPLRGETVASATGGPLGGIVALPGCDHDARVTGIAWIEGADERPARLRIGIEERIAPLTGAPAGVTVDWLDAA